MPAHETPPADGAAQQSRVRTAPEVSGALLRPSPQPRGCTLTLKAGDVAILPSGTGHQCLKADEDFVVVGAYPPSGTYDECTSVEDRKKAMTAILRVARPRKDPVFGKDGPLVRVWRKQN